jgi:tetratricopeptide (TPR) repeat protein
LKKTASQEPAIMTTDPLLEQATPFRVPLLQFSAPTHRFSFRLGALSFLLATGGLAIAQSTPAPPNPPSSNPAPATPPDRAAAYYHYALAHSYEEMATNYGRGEYATRAVEEYKLALNADPTSQFLNNGLAELYFKTGKIKDAIVAAQDLLKKDPNNLDAHRLLGRIYLRSLGDGQSGGPSTQVLQLAIDEYTKIVALEPNSIEDRLLLGQLYSVNHETAKAEEQFKAAQKIDPGSEEVILNLARLYSEQGDTQRAIDVLSAIPEDDRTPRTEFALGGAYDQIKEPKKAIQAYRRAVDLDPSNLDAERSLAQALLNDNDLDEALTSYQNIATADPQDANAYLRIAEIQRRKGSYDESLASLKKARSLSQEPLQLTEISFNESLADEALGKHDEAAAILQKLVEQSEHSTGQYSDAEKNARAFFLDRLAVLYREQDKPLQAVDVYHKMLELGGEFTVEGYQGEVDSYREAKQYAKATEVAREAAAKLPNDRDVTLMLAGQLADTGKPDEGIALAKGLLANPPTAENRPIHIALANIYTRLKRWNEAAAQLDLAEPLATKQDEKVYIYFLRGALAERQKHYDEAEAQFRKVLAIDPNNSMTLNYLGYMQADRGVQLDEALAMIQKAVKEEPQNYAYLDSLGWAYFKLGQYQLSEDNLRRATERNASDPTVHDHLGDLYEKTGRLKLAVAQWEQSVSEYDKTITADADPLDISKVHKKLENAWVRLAKEDATTGTAAKRQ